MESREAWRDDFPFWEHPCPLRLEKRGCEYDACRHGSAWAYTAEHRLVQFASNPRAVDAGAGGMRSIPDVTGYGDGCF